MLNIADALKTTYKNDTIPTVPQNVRKDLEIYFPALNLTIRTDQIVDDSFSLDESLFSDSDIVLGSCESSQIKFTLADVTVKLKGQEFTIVQKIGSDTIPLGTYKVDSAKEQDNLRFKDVIAYDNMKKFDVDVATWYNSLTFPLTLKTFRNLLCNFVGAEYEDSNLLNDAMQVTKTIDPKALKGKQVLIACEEINGAYGHIGRSGTLQHITLNNTVKETYMQPTAIEVRFEEYIVKAIDTIQIRQEEGDVGALVGEGTNVYAIQGNFLVYGKSAQELAIIANNILATVGGKPYRQFTAETIGLPYMEVGDYVSFPQNDTVNTFILKRALRGIQALRDSLEANGSEYIKIELGVNEEIIQLKGKAAVLKRTVEELSNTITDVEEGLTNEIQQTADEINLRITQVEKIYDSAAESTQGEGIPTLENYPAMNWTDEVYPGTDQYPSETETWTYSAVTYDKHLGTVYYDNANQKAYRFTLIDGVYQWKEITDALTATIINKISSLEMTTDSIETNVSVIETKVNNDLYTKIETQSLVTQTATGITQTVSSTYETKSNALSTKNILQSSITQVASEIELKVDNNGIIAAINLTSEAAKISAGKINLEGYVTVTALGQAGATTINGSNIKTGTIDASLVSVVNLNANNITAGTISADNISGGTLNGIAINAPDINTASLKVQGTSSSATYIYPNLIETAALNVSRVNGYTPITSNNLPRIPNSTLDIYPDLTSSGNIDFDGSENAASVNWVQANYQPKSASDFRLKKNIKSLEDLPDELYMAIKTKQFEFKVDSYGKGTFFGVLAQELESAFASFGLNAFDYNIVELADVRSYTDDGMFVSDKIHRVNYDNFIAWTIMMVQKLYKTSKTI